MSVQLTRMSVKTTRMSVQITRMIVQITRIIVQIASRVPKSHPESQNPRSQNHNGNYTLRVEITLERVVTHLQVSYSHAYLSKLLSACGNRTLCV
jgi:DNA/RNA endonuclease YhcR with UshA esterase domain